MENEKKKKRKKEQEVAVEEGENEEGGRKGRRIEMKQEKKKKERMSRVVEEEGQGGWISCSSIGSEIPSLALRALHSWVPFFDASLLFFLFVFLSLSFCEWGGGERGGIRIFHM